MIIIGGTGYTGEIKKGNLFQFLILFYLIQNNVLSIIAGANVGKKGDTAIIFWDFQEQEKQLFLQIQIEI